MTPENLPLYFATSNPGALPATLYPAQLWVQNHLWAVEGFWWLTYTAVLAYLVARFIVLPLLGNPRRRRR